MAFSRSRALLALLLGVAPLGACDCSTEPTPEVLVAIQDFAVSEVVPPASPSGGLLQVVPRSSVTLTWRIEGPARRVVLAANDRVIAEPEPGAEGSFTDACDDGGTCATAEAGDVLYTLTVIGSGEHATSDTRSVQVRVASEALRIASFTSSAATIDRGSDVTLSWVTAGATTVRLEATPVGGGETRTLGTFGNDGAAGAPTAREGSVVDPALDASTEYRLVAEGPGGATEEATIVVALRGDAFLTGLSSSAARAHAGEEVTLTWSSIGLESLAINRDDGGAAITDLSAAEVAAGSRTVTIQQTTRFSFVGVSLDGDTVTERCDAQGCGPAELVIELRPPPSIATFAADDAEVASGAGTTLRWTAAEADALVLSWTDADGDHAEAVAPLDDGSFAVVPLDTTTYTLTATSAGAPDAVSTALVGVRPSATITAPPEAFAGDVITVSWTTAGATGVALSAAGAPVPLGGAPADAGSVQLQVGAELPEGALLDLSLVATDDEAPPRASTPATATVTVHRRASFDAGAFDVASIVRGDPATLAWETSDAAAVRVSPPAPTRDPALLEAAVPLDPVADQVLAVPADGAVTVPLPFEWPAPGGFAEVHVHEDGVLAFGSAAPGASDGPLAAASGEALVAALWDDLAQDASSQILVRYDTATPGARRAVVEWRALRRAAGDDADELTFQAVLREDGHVQLSWLSLSLASGADALASATIGVATDAALTWATAAPGAATEGDAVVFATGALPADGALSLSPRATFAPTLSAIGAFGAPATVSPGALAVVPYRVSTAARPYRSLAGDPGAAALTPSAPDDGEVAAVPLPFAFPFFDAPRASVTVSTNGYLGFAGAGSSASPQVLPDPAAPNALVAALWDDLELGTGTIESLAVPAGDADFPDGAFVIEWRGVAFPARHGGGAGDDLTFEAVLLPSGDVELRYASLASSALAGADPRAEGALATIGLEDDAGSLGVLHAAAQPGSIQVGDAVVFDYVP